MEHLPCLSTPTTLCWLRRDLRLHDHHALAHALKTNRPVVCVFLFDEALLHGLPETDRRVDFFYRALEEIQSALRACSSELVSLSGRAEEALPALARRLGAQEVVAARDYEPGARSRDALVDARLAEAGCTLTLVKDQVVFETDEILTRTGKPFTVFTPYKKAWLARLTAGDLSPHAVDLARARLQPLPPLPLPSLESLGFARVDWETLHVKTGAAGAEALVADFLLRMDRYKTQRDYPAIKGPSYLSPHLRFGTVSVRELARLAWENGSEGAATWLSELIWREFYQQLLWHFPQVAEESFRPEYRALSFENNPEWFAAWREGRTGYPLVDAAMRQLNQTGYMHNRLRMVAASFLVKDLLVDWRWGERYFAAHLLDYDLAANNGGWQWAASTGCDAQPYFRIFNPVTQSRTFDPTGRFIRRYVPELAGLDDQAIHAPWLARALPAGFRLGQHYPRPIVDHAEQRTRALALFGRPAP